MKKENLGKRRRSRQILSMLLAIALAVTAIPPMPITAQETKIEKEKAPVVLEYTPLSQEVEEQKVPFGTPEEQLNLPDTLEAVEVGEVSYTSGSNAQQENKARPISLSGITWESETAYQGDVAGTYWFTPKPLEGYTLAEGVSLPVITIVVEEELMEERAVPFGEVVGAPGTSGTCSWEIDSAGTLRIWPSDGKDGTLGEADSSYSSTTIPWYSERASVKSVVVEPGVKMGTGPGGMFMNLMNCTSMDLKYLDTSNATSMSLMFANCSSLNTLELSSFDTTRVTQMDSMFAYCSSLRTLDLSSFDTAAVTNMSNMFFDCSSLTTLDVSSFDTTNVTNMDSMLRWCRNLTTLDLSSFDTTNVTNMNFMFQGSYGLTTIDLSSFDTAAVTNMYSMFANCSSLRTLDVSSFDTSAVNNMRSMFDNCVSLTDLDLSNFDTTEVIYMDSMFYACINLRTLDVSSFDTNKVTSMRGMFANCSSLISLDLTNFSLEGNVEFLLENTTLGLNINYYNGAMGGTKLYIYNKHSKEELNNMFLTGKEKHLIYAPYEIRYPDPVEHGSITLSYEKEEICREYYKFTKGFSKDPSYGFGPGKSYAYPWQKVSITLSPDVGYRPESLQVNPVGGGTLPPEGSFPTYFFTMYPEDVKISAGFNALWMPSIDVMPTTDLSVWQKGNTPLSVFEDGGSGTISDPIQKLFVKIDNNAREEITDFKELPYTYQASMEGEHTYQFLAQSRLGALAGSPPVTVKIDKPPTFTTRPTVPKVRDTSADITLTSSEEGKVYWLASSTKPKAEEIKAKNNSTSIMGGNQSVISVTGLSPKTRNQVYFLLEDRTGNISDIASQEFYTRPAAPGITLSDLQVNYQDETFRLPQDMEVYTDPENPEGSLLKPEPGKLLKANPKEVLYLRYQKKTAADGEIPPSTAVTITMPDRPSLPKSKTLAASYTTLTVEGVLAGAEYAMAPKGSSCDWSKKNTTGRFVGLSPNTAYTLYARTAAVAGKSFASLAVETEGTTGITILAPTITGAGKDQPENTAVKPTGEQPGGTILYKGSYHKDYTPVLAIGGKNCTLKMTWNPGTQTGTWSYEYSILATDSKIQAEVVFRGRTLTGVTAKDAIIFADDKANESASSLKAWLDKNRPVMAGYDNHVEEYQPATYTTADAFDIKGSNYTYTAVGLEGHTDTMTLTVKPVTAAIPPLADIVKSKDIENGYTQAQLGLPSQIQVTYTADGYLTRTQAYDITWKTENLPPDFGKKAEERLFSGTISLPQWATNPKGEEVEVRVALLTDDEPPVITVGESGEENREGWYEFFDSFYIVVDEKTNSALCSGIEEITWRKDGDPAETIIELPSGKDPVLYHAFEIPVTENGIHTYYINAKDKMGNKAKEEVFTIKMETRTPGFTKEPTVNKLSDTTADITLTANLESKLYWMVNPQSVPSQKEMKEQGTKEELIPEKVWEQNLENLTPDKKQTIYFMLESRAGKCAEIQTLEFYTLRTAPTLTLSHEEIKPIPPEKPEQPQLLSEGSSAVDSNVHGGIQYPKRTKKKGENPKNSQELEKKREEEMLPSVTKKKEDTKPEEKTKKVFCLIDTLTDHRTNVNCRWCLAGFFGGGAGIIGFIMWKRTGRKKKRQLGEKNNS